VAHQPVSMLCVGWAATFTLSLPGDAVWRSVPRCPVMQMAFQDYFSVIAFFIFLRETLEASVIIAVLLQCMNRTCPRLKKQGGQRTCRAWHLQGLASTAHH